MSIDTPHAGAFEILKHEWDAKDQKTLTDTIRAQRLAKIALKFSEQADELIVRSTN